MNGKEKDKQQKNGKRCEQAFPRREENMNSPSTCKKMLNLISKQENGK